MTQSQPGNRVRAGEASRTALRVATLRAAHQVLDEPIVLDDPFALKILGHKAEAEIREDPFQFNDVISRVLRAALVVRSRFAEEELARAVAKGVTQYVVLGAGLDTFAYRNPYAETEIQVFEVDHPATQDWKRQSLKEAGIAIPGNLTFAPVDFEHSTLAQGLSEACFRADQPACFSWLGVTMYLTEPAIMETLNMVAKMPKGSSITFDYQVPLSRLNPIERAIFEFMAPRVAAQGEPWISAYEPEILRQKVLDLGFSEVAAWEPDALNRLYLHRRKDGLKSSGRLICARV